MNIVIEYIGFINRVADKSMLLATLIYGFLTCAVSLVLLLIVVQITDSIANIYKAHVEIVKIKKDAKLKNDIRREFEKLSRKSYNQGDIDNAIVAMMQCASLLINDNRGEEYESISESNIPSSSESISKQSRQDTDRLHLSTKKSFAEIKD